MKKYTNGGTKSKIIFVLSLFCVAIVALSVGIVLSRRGGAYCQKNVEKVDEEAKELLSQNLDDDGDAVRELYVENYNNCIAREEADIANQYLSNGVNQLIADGKGEWALDLLLIADLDKLPAMDRCLKYFDIIALANEIEELEVSSYHESLVLRAEDGLGNKCTFSETAAKLYNKVLEEREKLLND